MPQAERHEFMVTFDVGHQVEHLIRAVMDVPHLLKSRHLFLRRTILPWGSEAWHQALLYEKAKPLIPTSAFQWMQVNISGERLRQTARMGPPDWSTAARGVNLWT